MVISVNESVRETVILELYRRKMTRSELASKAGLSRPYVSRLLSGEVEGGREAWEAIFKVLELQLTAKPKASL